MRSLGKYWAISPISIWFFAGFLSFAAALDSADAAYLPRSSFSFKNSKELSYSLARAWRSSRSWAQVVNNLAISLPKEAISLKKLGWSGYFSADLSLNESFITLLSALWEDQSALFFGQAAFGNSEKRVHVNLGLGYRHFMAHKLIGDMMLGVNSFLDYDLSAKYLRLAGGLEFAYEDGVELAINGYYPLSSWQDSYSLLVPNFYLERPAKGFDIRVKRPLAQHGKLALEAYFERYYGEQVALMPKGPLVSDAFSLAIALIYQPMDFIRGKMTYRWSPDYGALFFGFDIFYDLSTIAKADLPSGKKIAVKADKLQGLRYDFVKRNHNIILSYKKYSPLNLKAKIVGFAGDSISIIKDAALTEQWEIDYWDKPESLILSSACYDKALLNQCKLTLPPYRGGRFAGANNYLLTLVLGNNNNAQQYVYHSEVIVKPKASDILANQDQSVMLEIKPFLGEIGYNQQAQAEFSLNHVAENGQKQPIELSLAQISQQLKLEILEYGEDYQSPIDSFILGDSFIDSQTDSPKAERDKKPIKLSKIVPKGGGIYEFSLIAVPAREDLADQKGGSGGGRRRFFELIISYQQDKSASVKAQQKTRFALRDEPQEPPKKPNHDWDFIDREHFPIKLQLSASDLLIAQEGGAALNISYFIDQDKARAFEKEVFASQLVTPPALDIADFGLIVSEAEQEAAPDGEGLYEMGKEMGESAPEKLVASSAIALIPQSMDSALKEERHYELRAYRAGEYIVNLIYYAKANGLRKPRMIVAKQRIYVTDGLPSHAILSANKGELDLLNQADYIDFTLFPRDAKGRALDYVQLLGPQADIANARWHFKIVQSDSPALSFDLPLNPEKTGGFYIWRLWARDMAKKLAPFLAPIDADKAPGLGTAPRLLGGGQYFAQISYHGNNGQIISHKWPFTVSLEPKPDGAQPKPLSQEALPLQKIELRFAYYKNGYENSPAYGVLSFIRYYLFKRDKISGTYQLFAKGGDLNSASLKTSNIGPLEQLVELSLPEAGDYQIRAYYWPAASHCQGAAGGDSNFAAACFKAAEISGARADVRVKEPALAPHYEVLAQFGDKIIKDRAFNPHSNRLAVRAYWPASELILRPYELDLRILDQEGKESPAGAMEIMRSFASDGSVIFFLNAKQIGEYRAELYYRSDGGWHQLFRQNFTVVER